MKAKIKPVAKAEIRERVERKFRARGAVAFHLLLMLGAGILLIYNLPELLASAWNRDGFIIHLMLYGILCTAGALHFIHYYFRHGRGRARHEAAIEARIERRLRQAAAEEADEQEELARIQANDQLKNRRLVWQHLAIYTGITLTFVVGHTANMPGVPLLEWGTWRDVVAAFASWGIGLAAHVLRYVFAYGFSAGRREAKIEAQIARELRGLDDNGASRMADGRAVDLAIEDMEEARQRAVLRTKER